MAAQIICELVTIDDDYEYLVQYENTPDDLTSKKSCLAYLRDCGHEVTTEPHAIVGIGDDPAVSWGDLSDTIAPRDF
jgi:hypothetical protein